MESVGVFTNEKAVLFEDLMKRVAFDVLQTLANDAQQLAEPEKILLYYQVALQGIHAWDMQARARHTDKYLRSFSRLDQLYTFVFQQYVALVYDETAQYIVPRFEIFLFSFLGCITEDPAVRSMQFQSLPQTERRLLIQSGIRYALSDLCTACVDVEEGSVD